MSVLTVETFGFKFYERKFTAMEQRTIRLKPAMEAVAAYLMDITEERFHKEGPGWAPLSQEWLIAKASQGLDPRILRARGGLFTSVTVPGSKGSVLVITNNNIDYGSSLPYARTMQFGGKSPRGGIIPARPYIGATPPQREVIAEIIARYITAPIRDAPIVGKPRPGDFVTGTSRGRPVQGILSDVQTSTGGFMLRNPAGQFVGVYKD